MAKRRLIMVEQTTATRFTIGEDRGKPLHYYWRIGNPNGEISKATGPLTFNIGAPSLDKAMIHAFNHYMLTSGLRNQMSEAGLSYAT